jgi:hypothetical protein
MNRFIMRFSAAVGTGALLIASAGLASADNVLSDDVAAGGNTTLTLVAGTASTTIDFRIVGNGSDGCNVTPAAPGTLSAPISGGPAGGLTASAPSGPFTKCVEGPNKNQQTITFTATQPGIYTVNATVTDGLAGNNGFSTVNFTITVNGPSNTAPTVAVTGVTDGGVYELGAVPVAGCQVTDTQDGNSTHAASLSSITGPLAAYGIGSQTATCTHTDSGGSSATPASATYTIDDTTDPALVGVPSDQVIEATSSAGAVATWTDPTATDLGVVDSVSCVPASGSSFPFGATTVTCSATDKAGNSSSDTFSVTVSDTTDPTIVGGAGNTVEATGPLTPVTFTEPTATDTADDSVPVTCVPASGSSFAVGSTTVTCTATDDSGNSSSVDLTVVVTDTTGPEITVPDVEDVEATRPGGAAVSFSPTAVDLVEGARDVFCDYNSGDTFPLGTTTVNCSSEDTRGNASSASFTVEVVDTTAPELTVTADFNVEATGPGGATATFSASATDIVDTEVTVSCIPPSGSNFSLGANLVTCTAVDDSGNEDEASFTITVVDTTPPTVTVPSGITEEATGPAGAVVTFTATATDLVDGDVTPTCTPSSGTTFPLGTTEVTCSATDAAGNTGSDTFDVTVVDTTGPDLTLPTNITTGATSAAGATVNFTATANDLVDGPVTVDCTPPSGSTFAPGTTPVNCSASDAAGNTTNGSFTVTVSFAWTGFFAPVDNGGVFNVVKGGQSVPIKWRISNGSGGWISSLSVVSTVTQTKIACTNTSPTDEVEAPTSGATSLRYDTTDNQYIYNWQSPKGAGLCYRVTVYLTDGTSHAALFKTK